MKKPNLIKNETAIRNLKIAIALSDKTAAQISREAGLSINVLGKYLKGDSDIAFSNMKSVCEVLNTPIGLIASKQQITEARVRLFKILLAADEPKIAKIIKSLED